MVESSLGNPAILSSVGACLLLNMKEAGAKGLNEGMGSSAGSRGTVSEMDFTAPPITSHAECDEGTVEDIELAED